MSREDERIQMSATNGNKMLTRQRQIQSDLEYYLEKGFAQSRQEMIHKCNKALYDLAEQRGISLWDLCFSVVPRWQSVGDSFAPTQKGDIITINAEYELKLIPLEIDFEHGPEYWEMKYRKLNREIKKLIEENHD